MICIRLVKWFFTICWAGAPFFAQKRVIFFLLFLLFLFAIRHLTFLPFNPIIDPFFPENTTERKNLPAPASATDHTPGESDYPIVSHPISPEMFANSKNKKLLLLWTTFFDAEDWELGVDISSDIYQLPQPNCPVQNCFVTRNRTLLSEASAVIFHFYNIQKYDLPQNRPSNQFWVFTLFESPEHTYNEHYITSRTSKRLLATDYKAFFNWTMTYRTDSDVTLFYGLFKRSKHEPNETSPNEPKFSMKTRTAVAFISRCDTSSKRLEYIREMQRYIDVDIVGACSDSQSSHLADPYCRRRSETFSLLECHDFVSTTYKFYLAFENSFCGDYVTEKFFRAASLNLVPVVLNGVLDMSKFAPPQSYINAGDFGSPKDLARYLEYVGNHKELYEAYFWWKPYYEIEYIFKTERAFCGACAKLAEVEQAAPGSSAKVYEDIDTWWTKGTGECRPGKILPNQTLRNLLDRILFVLIVSLIICMITKPWEKRRKQQRPSFFEH